MLLQGIAARPGLFPELQVAEVAGGDFLGPMAGDQGFEGVGAGFGEKKAGVDGGGVGDDPEAEAGGAAAVAHGFAHFDEMGGLYGGVLGKEPVDVSVYGGVLLRFMG